MQNPSPVDRSFNQLFKTIYRVSTCFNHPFGHAEFRKVGPPIFPFTPLRPQLLPWVLIESPLPESGKFTGNILNIKIGLKGLIRKGKTLSIKPVLKELMFLNGMVQGKIETGNPRFSA